MCVCVCVCVCVCMCVCVKRWLCNKSPWKDEDELELVSSAAGDEEVKTGVKEEPSESMATAKHSRCQDERWEISEL